MNTNEILRVLGKVYGWHVEELYYQIMSDKKRFGVEGMNVNEIKSEFLSIITDLVFSGYINVNNGCIRTNKNRRKPKSFYTYWKTSIDEYNRE